MILCRSTPDQLERDVDQNLVAVFEDDLQIELEVDVAPEVFHGGAGVVPGQDHVERDLEVAGYVSIADLD
jgi:hypothetical protein